MTNSELLLKRGEQLRKVARILTYVFIVSVALFVLGGLIHALVAASRWDFGKSWLKYLSMNPYKKFKIANVISIISYIGAGIGLLSIPLYAKALDWLGLGQIAKNTEK